MAGRTLLDYARPHSMTAAMPPIFTTLKNLPARYWCNSAAALISLYFGASFVRGVLWRGEVHVVPWLLALMASLALAALPWCWLRYHRHTLQNSKKTPSIHEQTLARAHADLASLRENAAQYRSRANGERIGLLLEQLCNHSERYLEELRGDDERIRANRALLTVYLPELSDISLLYLQLPAKELSGQNRRQLLQLVRDIHDHIEHSHLHQQARTLTDLETRMEVLRERLDGHAPASQNLTKPL